MKALSSFSFSSSWIHILWPLAFICALYPVNDFQLEFFVSAILLTLLWAALRLGVPIDQPLACPKTPVLLLIPLFWIWIGCSIFISDIKGITLMGFCVFAMMPLSCFLFVLRPDIKVMHKIAYALGAIFALLSVWAMVQFFVFNDYFDGRAHHPMNDPNALAALFSLVFFSALGWLLYTTDKTQSRLALGLCILLVGGIMMTGSRGALIAAFVTLPVFLFFMRAHLLKHWKCLALVACAALVFFVLTTLGESTNENMVTRVADTLSMVKADASNNRFHIWAGTWAMIRDHWLFGTGFATFYLYYPQYRTADDFAGTFMAHSDPLQFWAELGIIGLLLYMCILISVLWRTIRVLRVADRTTPAYHLFTVTTCALLAFTLHSFINFNFYLLPALFLVGFLFAVWILSSTQILKDRLVSLDLPHTLPPEVRQFVFIIPWVLLAWVFGSQVLGEHFVNRARDALFAGNLEGYIQNINTANTVSYRYNYRAYLLAIDVPLAILKQEGVLMDDEKRLGFYHQIKTFTDETLALNPVSASTYYYKGFLSQLMPERLLPEDADDPEAMFHQALALDPLHIAARLALADIYDKRGEKERALEILKEGLAYRYRTPEAIKLYGQIAIRALAAGDRPLHEKATGHMQSFHAHMQKSHDRKQRGFLSSLAE